MPTWITPNHVPAPDRPTAATVVTPTYSREPCLLVHPHDQGPIRRRCRRLRGHDGAHCSDYNITLGDQWVDVDGAA